MLAEAPELHGVGDGLDALHGAQDQRDENGTGSLQALDQADLFAHLYAPGLLGQGDLPVLPLDIRDVAQGQGHGIADPVADADFI